MTTDDTEECMTQRILRISDIVKQPCDTFMSKIEVETMLSVSLVSLARAVQPLVHFLPDIQHYVHIAKQKCKKPPADGLTVDESSSIILYSMGWKPTNKCLYSALNAALRSRDRDKLKSWYLYLKLFLTALSHLPSANPVVFRGVKLDLHKDYRKDETIVWWGFSSCTASLDVLQSELFLGTKGTRTMFTIECNSGKDIRKHSYFPKEDEILILPATHFIVAGNLDQGNNLHTIQLREIKPPDPHLYLTALPSELEKLSIHAKTNKKLQTILPTTQSEPPDIANSINHTVIEPKIEMNATALHDTLPDNSKTDIEVNDQTEAIETTAEIESNRTTENEHTIPEFIQSTLSIDVNGVCNEPRRFSRRLSSAVSQLFAFGRNSKKEVTQITPSGISLPLPQKKVKRCGGVACLRCGKCRDWKYDGNIDRDFERWKREGSRKILLRKHWHCDPDAACRRDFNDRSHYHDTGALIFLYNFDFGFFVSHVCSCDR